MPPAHDRAFALYGGADPRDLGRYAYPDAARATGVPASTIASWFRGQEYTWKTGGRTETGFFSPVLGEKPESGLSFNNLIEVFILRSLRTKHAIKFDRVREALETAQREFRIDRLLLSQELCAGAGQLFLERYGKLVELNRVEQLNIEAVLLQTISRIGFDRDLPRHFSPISRMTETKNQLILVSSFVSFGKPVVARTGVSTSAVADRVLAGEPKQEVQADFSLTDGELAEVLAYEAAA